MQRVGVGRARALAAPLQVVLDLGQRGRVDQVAQLLLAQQLAQQVAVQRQRGGPALRVGRVALVHVRGHVVEQQRRGERGRALGLDLDQAQLARVQPAQQLLQAGQVEHVAQALAVGLQHDRELAVLLGHLQQRLRLQPLLPQRRALARVGARQQQRACRVLAEAGAVERRGRQLADHQLLDLVGLDQHQLGAGRLVRVGQVDDDPVVRPDGVGLQPEAVADAGAQRQAPRGVHAAAERRQHAQAPVADLVAEALDHDRLVAGHDARGLALLAQVGHQVGGGAVVQVVLGGQLGGLAVDGRAGELADGLAQLGGAADAVALPVGQRAGRAGRGGHDHAVAGDLLDPPGRGAQHERLAGAGLVDHLLVQLADAAAVGQVHAVQAAVGDRAGVGHRQLARALARADGVLHAVPDDPRAQLAELLGRVAPVEHVQHLVEQLAREVGVGVGAAHQVVQLAGLPVVAGGHHRHDLLGQHVQRVARDHGGLDQALAHALGHHRALQEVGAELGEDPALGRVAHVVAGAADALQARGHRLGRLDLQHQVHRAHVDAQLQRARWPPGTAGRRTSAGPRRPAAPRAPASRGGRGRSRPACPRRPPARSAAPPAARRRGGCSRR